MPLVLTAQIGDATQRWKLEGPLVRVGRSSRNDIQISHATVSKEHAEFVRQGDRYLLRDLGSRNGTRVNGAEAKEPLPVAAGDLIEIGHFAVHVTTDGATPQVRFSDATVIGSSLRLRSDQLLERRAASRDGARTLMRLLADAGQLLVLPRPLRETCDQILTFVEKAVPGARHILLLREDGGEELVQMAARIAGSGAERPLALSRSIVRTVLEDCASVITGDAASDPRFMGQQSVIAQSVHSAMAVPLFDNEHVLGLIYVDSQDLAHRFGEEQLEVLTLLANMAAVKITNARLLEAEEERARMAQELAAATQIQRGLLPYVPPLVAGCQFEAFIESCHEVGGDLYDIYTRADGGIVFVVGDVTGKGMGAALLMSSFLSSSRVLYDTCPDPGDFATRLSAHVARNTDPGRFVTGFVGWLDPATGTLRYVNAGHPSPRLVLDGVIRPLESTGVPFGILPDWRYEAATVEMRPGELLALFSDGIPEAQRGEELFDEERIDRALLELAPLPALEEIRRQLVARVDDFLAGESRTDDLTVMLVRRSAATAGTTA